MLCPTCESDHFKIYELDPDLMVCEKCHAIHSKAWSIGYWMGHIDGERKAREDFLTWARQRYKDEVVNRPGENIYRNILNDTWQEIIDRLEEL